MSDLQPDSNLLQASISYNSFTVSHNRTSFKGLSGSTQYESSYNSYSFKKTKKTIEKKPKKDNNSDIEKIPTAINKSKLKRKINAFFRLNQSKKFTAFYSISFPLHFPDDSAMIVLNNVLTSLRKNSLKFNYIWVAERQKNGTVHFHILLNRFLNIRVTNFLFAKAIQNEIKVSGIKNMNFNRYKYNGCDVKYVRNQGSLNSYMTKYVTKNDDKFLIRGWSSDQITSSLFTAISYHVGEIKMDNHLFYYDESNEVLSFGDNFFTTYPLKHPPENRLMHHLEYANNEIAKGFDKLESEFDNLKTRIIEPIINIVEKTEKQLKLAM